jgi:hypothetical protein
MERERINGGFEERGYLNEDDLKAYYYRMYQAF